MTAEYTARHLQPMRPLALACLVALLYALHQDVWFWRTADPIVFGFLPIGLFYHVAFTAACSLMLWWFVRSAWPSHLEAESPRRDPAGSPRS